MFTEKLTRSGHNMSMKKSCVVKLIQQFLLFPIFVINFAFSNVNKSTLSCQSPQRIKHDNNWNFSTLHCLGD